MAKRTIKLLSTTCRKFSAKVMLPIAVHAIDELYTGEFLYVRQGGLVGRDALDKFAADFCGDPPAF